MTATTWTVNAIKDHVRAAGSHWFDPDTMRCFGTRVLPTVYQGDGGVYFVTSDKRFDGSRGYTVRQFFPGKASIRTVEEGERGLADYGKREAVALAKKRAGAVLDSIPAETSERFRPVSVPAQFLADLLAHGNGNAHEQTAGQLMRWARTHHKAMEDACNGLEVYDADGEPLHGLKELQEHIIRAARQCGATGVVFSGDPRGCTVKLVFADGATNDFGKEGWCVPTSEREEAEES